jgi:hypothetical protein
MWTPPDEASYDPMVHFYVPLYPSLYSFANADGTPVWTVPKEWDFDNLEGIDTGNWDPTTWDENDMSTYPDLVLLNGPFVESKWFDIRKIFFMADPEDESVTYQWSVAEVFDIRVKETEYNKWPCNMDDIIYNQVAAMTTLTADDFPIWEGWVCRNIKRMIDIKKMIGEDDGINLKVDL